MNLLFIGCTSPMIKNGVFYGGSVYVVVDKNITTNFKGIVGAYYIANSPIMSICTIDYVMSIYLCVKDSVV